MPNIDKHKPGSFCWMELATSDQEAAKKFYTTLFGWDVNDQPMGPGEFYSMFNIGGRNTGAAYTLRPEHKAAGMPPHWVLYIAVESADKAAERAAQVGGTVMAPPFDVFDAGRMAVVQDPTGAMFCIWQPNKQPGIAVTGENTLCWADLSTPDPARATKFYSDLFGWELTKDEKDSSGYLHIKNKDEFIGGIQPSAQRNPNAPPHWLSYIAVASCDTSAAKAKQLGGKFYLEPLTMEGVGRMAVVADPQGAVFAIFQPMPRN